MEGTVTMTLDAYNELRQAEANLIKEVIDLKGLKEELYAEVHYQSEIAKKAIKGILDCEFNNKKYYLESYDLDDCQRLGSWKCAISNDTQNILRELGVTEERMQEEIAKAWNKVQAESSKGE